MRRAAIAIAIGLALTIAVRGWWGSRTGPEAVSDPIGLRDAGPALTIALTGDIVAGQSMHASLAEHDTGMLSAILSGASLAITDLDQRLQPADGGGDSGWAVGGLRLARELRGLGFTVVTAANDHVYDGNPQSIANAVSVLADAGLRTAGLGSNLDAARQPAVLSGAADRIAVLAAATSVDPSARATRDRGEIRGRPGVNSVRYSAAITADPATFAALAQMAALGVPGTSQTGTDGELQMSGTSIKRGTATSVELIADPSDVTDLLDDIRRARADAGVVVLSLHTHEPANRVDAPAPFVRDLARQAVDAGAAVVVAHGARQLRGIEVHGGGVIFYGLGSLVFRRDALGSRAATVYDADISAYELALGGQASPSGFELPSYSERFWWESMLATVEMKGSSPGAVVLTPIALGQQGPDRGLPRVARGAEAAAILSRVQQLSAVFGTRIAAREDKGFVERASANGAAPARD